MSEDKTEHGTVTTEPYVGDTDLIVAKCKHGDYHRVFKGKTEAQGAKALAEHYATKHPEET